jgi:hypothetical protein
VKRLYNCLGSSDTATKIIGLTDITVIAASRNSSLAIKANGTAWSLYHNGLDPINSSSVTDYGNQGFTNTVNAGSPHFLSIKEFGSVWACGGNDLGQLVMDPMLANIK